MLYFIQRYDKLYNYPYLYKHRVYYILPSHGIATRLNHNRLTNTAI